MLLGAWKPSGAKRALWHTALLFSLIHLQPNNLPALLFLGLVLGSVSLETGSVYPAIVIHGVNNLIAVLISNLASAEAASDLPAAADMLPALALSIVFGLSLGIPSFYALRFFAKRRREQQTTAHSRPYLLPRRKPAVPVRRGPFVPLTYVFMILLNAAVVASLFIQIPGFKGHLRIAIACVGRLKERYWREAAAEYVKRLSRYAQTEILEVEDEPAPETVFRRAANGSHGARGGAAFKSDSCAAIS